MTIETLSFAELHAAYAKANDPKTERAIVNRVAQLIAELDSDYDPESGEPEPDFIGAAKDYLNSDEPDRY